MIQKHAYWNHGPYLFTFVFKWLSCYLPLLHALQRIQLPMLFSLPFCCPFSFLRRESSNMCAITDNWQQTIFQFINNTEWMQFAWYACRPTSQSNHIHVKIVQLKPSELSRKSFASHKHQLNKSLIFMCHIVICFCHSGKSLFIVLSFFCFGDSSNSMIINTSLFFPVSQLL